MIIANILCETISLRTYLHLQNVLNMRYIHLNDVFDVLQDIYCSLRLYVDANDRLIRGNSLNLGIL